MPNHVQFDAGGTVQAAISSIQKGVEGTHFLVLGYCDRTTLCVVASGPGGLDAARPHLPVDTERYIYLRKDHQVEMARTVKFAFVSWFPSKLKFLRKTLLLFAHKGQVRDLLQPHHCILDCTEEEDLDDSVIMDKISISTGTRVHATQKKAGTALTRDDVPEADVSEANNTSQTFSSSSNKSGKWLEDDEEAVTTLGTVRKLLMFRTGMFYFCMCVLLSMGRLG